MKIFNVIYNIIAITVILAFLFTVGVMATGMSVYAVATPSMAEEIPEGSLVFVRKAKSYSEGDVINAVFPSGGTFTHRIIELDSERQLVYTKGDSNQSVDPLPTPVKNINGKVVFSVPYLGLLSLNFNSTTVIFVLAAVLLVLVVVRLIITKKPKGGNRNEKAQ